MAEYETTRRVELVELPPEQKLVRDLDTGQYYVVNEADLLERYVRRARLYPSPSPPRRQVPDPPVVRNEDREDPPSLSPSFFDDFDFAGFECTECDKPVSIQHGVRLKDDPQTVFCHTSCARAHYEK